MTFIQCSLTATSLSWYIRLNTYKQGWSPFVQPVKNQISSEERILRSS